MLKSELRMLEAAKSRQKGPSKRRIRAFWTDISNGFMQFPGSDPRNRLKKSPAGKSGGADGCPDEGKGLCRRPYIMSSMPAGIGGVTSSFGASAIIASVVIISPATDAACCRAERVTLVGSRMPISIMSPYCPVAAL